MFKRTEQNLLKTCGLLKYLGPLIGLKVNIKDKHALNIEEKENLLLYTVLISVYQMKSVEVKTWNICKFQIH